MGDVERWLPLKPKWFHILLSLAETPRHGYAIRKDVEERSGGRVKLWPTALYGSIAALSEAGLISESGESHGDPRRIAYALTPLGRELLRAEAARLAELVRLARVRDRAASAGKA